MDFWGRRRKVENLDNSIVSFAFSFRHYTIYHVRIIVWNRKDFENILCVYYYWLENWPFFLDILWHISYSLGRVTDVAFGFPEKILMYAESVLSSWLCTQLLAVVWSIISWGEIVDTECFSGMVLNALTNCPFYPHHNVMRYYCYNSPGRDMDGDGGKVKWLVHGLWTGDGGARIGRYPPADLCLQRRYRDGGDTLSEIICRDMWPLLWILTIIKYQWSITQHHFL